MTENLGKNELPGQGSLSESYGDYLHRAAAALEAGDSVLAMHLYLAAYERAVVDPDIADGMALSGLQEAWNLACELKERSMAEYVFEKLEPFLTGEEIAQCANKLQDLALDRLAEYGFSREELQDMAEMISQDLIEGDGSVVKVESITIPRAQNMIEALAEKEEIAAGDAQESAEESGVIQEEPEQKKRKPENVGIGNAAPDFNPYDFYKTSSVGTSYHAATNEGAGSYVFTRDLDRVAEGERAKEAEEARKQSEAESSKKPQQVMPQLTTPTRTPDGKMPAMPEVPGMGEDVLNYRKLVGYDEAIQVMRDLGVGLQREQGFRNFVNMLNARHGLDRMPALDTLLFRAPVIEDATRFVDATVGELGLPVLRMSMEEGLQGAPLLCVTTYGNNRPRMNHAHNRFDGPGILVIDDLDTWIMPQVPDTVEGIAGFVMANMSRGAREAVSLIRSAVEDPEVYVLATATTIGEVDPFFYEILEPITIIDIALPNEAERAQIWDEIMRDHSSLRGLDREALARLSAGLPRYDIYMAARAAVEEAYKAGLVQRMYVPVTPQNIFDKLAACQPIDSDEYRAIEEEVVRDFRNDLDHLEDLIEGPTE